MENSMVKEREREVSEKADRIITGNERQPVRSEVLKRLQNEKHQQRYV